MIFSIVLMLLTSSAFAGSDENLIYEWPQFHGPKRDNISAETGLMKSWPVGGPRLVWTAKGIGDGYSAVAAANGLLYTTGNIEDDTVITALDLNGEEKWKARNGPSYKREQPGTRGIPTIEGGRLYHMNADGDVACLNAKTGGNIWSLNVLEKFEGRNIRWGLAESLLIDGNNLVCSPGGERAGMVALDKRTGETVWICEEIGDFPGYCSPIVFTCKGLRQIATLTARSVIGVEAVSGKLLWRMEHETPFDENINTPVYHDGHLFVCSRTTGARLFRIHVDGRRASVQ